MAEIVTPLDILHIERKTGKWYHRGRELQKAEIDNIKSEAEIIVKTSFWKLLINEGKYHAQKRATIDAKLEHDDTRKLALLKEAHAYHDVVVMIEDFARTITNK